MSDDPDPDFSIMLADALAEGIRRGEYRWGEDRSIYDRDGRLIAFCNSQGLLELVPQQYSVN